jgi:hypothetical protein
MENSFSIDTPYGPCTFEDKRPLVNRVYVNNPEKFRYVHINNRTDGTFDITTLGTRLADAADVQTYMDELATAQLCIMAFDEQQKPNPEVVMAIGQNRTIARVVEDFSQAVNYYGDPAPAFVEAFKRQHRTLQASMFRVLLKLIEALSSDDYRTDLRNEAVKEQAQLLLRGWEQALLRRDQWRIGRANGKPSDYIPMV